MSAALGLGCSFKIYLGSSTHLVKLVHVMAMTAWSLYSCVLECSKPELIETSADIHLPFDQVESVDLSFDWAIAPQQINTVPASLRCSL